MKVFGYISTFVLSAMGYQIAAQISPGKLAKAHSHLEGINNCTQCHDLGNKVPDAKCLACHKEIKSLIDQRRGYHSSAEVRRKECTDCHSDHHGLNFEMTRFDEKNFNHTLTGYELKGQHASIDCRECHKADHIADRELRKRSGTFLGLDTKCLACHDDFHQQTLSTNCLDCHNETAFRPAVKFDHDKADFRLRGGHKNTECMACHPMENRGGKEFQRFTDIRFNDCADCHSDPHRGHVPGKCNTCHVEESFKAFRGEGRFDHSLTDFDLIGAHRTTSCFECHERRPAATVFQDRAGLEENQCAACHADVHDSKFGNDCARCHQESSFLALKNLDAFDHSLTDFALEGLHASVDCKACHTGQMTDPLNYGRCMDCHDDYHNGDFVQRNPVSDCVDCHNTTEGFGWTSFGLAEHETTDFPLTGAHMATPCFECHISEDRWDFGVRSTDCTECHNNIHDGFISEPYLSGNDCTACHSTEAWDDVAFDHSSTKWELKGRHVEVSCGQCHFTAGDDESGQRFKGLTTECYGCHENVHGRQFEEEGITDCKRCHYEENWDPVRFNHNGTAFPLEGRHAEIECSACHKRNENDPEGQRNFKIEKFECIDCHS